MARILVVDDSIVMRKNLTTILEEDGHTIIGEASNGRQAITQYEELRPDIVTMDISMPIMSGVEAVQQIIAQFPEAKIVMISAVNQKKMVYNAITAGAKHYIIKPIESKKVLSVINEVLSNDSTGQITRRNEPTSTKQGFEINNVEGKFIIAFNESLDQSDYSLLNMAIRGIMFIKPLRVVFHFGELHDVRDDVLYPIVKLANEIVQSGGEISYVAKDSIKAKLQA